MALARVTAPTPQLCYPLIDCYFAGKHLRPVNYYKLLTIREVLALLPHVTNLKSYLIRSHTVHAVELKDGTILTHPDPVYQIFRNSAKARVRQLAVKSKQ